MLRSQCSLELLTKCFCASLVLCSIKNEQQQQKDKQYRDKPELSLASGQSFHLCHLFYLLRSLLTSPLGHYLWRHLLSFLYRQPSLAFGLFHLACVQLLLPLSSPIVLPFSHRLFQILFTLSHQFFLTPHSHHDPWHCFRVPHCTFSGLPFFMSPLLPGMSFPTLLRAAPTLLPG